MKEADARKIIDKVFKSVTRNRITPDMFELKELLVKAILFVYEKGQNEPKQSE